MAQTIGAKEALEICRSTKPTPGEMKKVLAWAQADPRPEKILPLLLLETGNFASRKDLDEPLHQALRACAAANTSELWKCIETDWDIYRVLHAIRAVGEVGSSDELARLVELGKTKIMRIHWSAIMDVARAKSLPVPEDVATAQHELEKHRGPTDFAEEYSMRRPGGADAPSPAQPRSAGSARIAPKQIQLGWPVVFSAEGEQNSYLKQYKQTRRDKWTLTRMEGLFEEVDLAWFLAALDRRDEAIEVVRHLSLNVTDTANKNIWTPVGYAICLEANLLRTAGRLAEAREALWRIIEEPFAVRLPRREIQIKFDSVPIDFEQASNDTSRKSACRKLARTMYRICYHLEMAAADLPDTQWYPRAQLGHYISDGLRRLRSRLEG